MSVDNLTAGDIITKFELQVNDLTELSSQEELDLLNDKIQELAAERPWEVLKKSATGVPTIDSTTGLYSITLPSDFNAFSENNMNTDNTLPVNNNASPKVVFIGATQLQPYQIVNYSDRIQYQNQGAVCYVDMNANKIFFPIAPAFLDFYRFDYVSLPPLLTSTTDTPSWIPNRFRKYLWFIMAVDDEILQRSSSANSQAPNNNAKAQKTLLDFNYWNDSLINN
jgi:hypothetical protein